MMEEITALSLLPPVLALVMIIVTRKVLLSLGVGIVIGALILNDWSFPEAIFLIWEVFAAIFIVDGALNDWELFIILFLFLLGMMAALISFSGGSRAFGEWALKRVKTRVGAQLTTLLFGILVFIDDYFNSLIVGQVSSPVTDRHYISREKLAYIVDSSAAPICVIAPLSSWGAYIITIIADILGTHGIQEVSGLQAFVMMIPMNFYAVTALLFLFLIIIWKIEIGPMKTFEEAALQGKGILTEKNTPGENFEMETKGKVSHLIVPILTLVISTVFFMVYTGAQNADNITLLSVFAETDVARSLLYGGSIGFIVALFLTLKNKPSFRETGQTLVSGLQSMLPAIYILIFAWLMVAIIDELGTGTYLAHFIDGTLPLFILPVILFVLAGFMAFSTGTSWGTFAILLPIAGEVAAVLDITMLLPLLASVLAGSIFGDHASPISDTTILSATGAGCHPIDHVMTQLPYALLSAVAAMGGYLMIGLTSSVLIGLGAAIAITIIIALSAKVRMTQQEKIV
ncbi:Na+/H+ antiporter NhaC family protein [Aliibacillus thermotolerans]|uniref:Na+/H+ antiporter NhaC family protein n=1 Tax=Aliibacillus thermotolerans TaxID=1834418 RepID=A0ABW0U952_9BACI